MREPWQQQIRIYLSEDGADLLRTRPDHPSVAPLLDVLRRHDATAVSQLDAFEAYLADPAQATSPLGRWSEATLADPAKRAKHKQAFAVRVRGDEVYPRNTADALQADLYALVGNGAVERLSRHDTNPENNLPIPQEYRT